MKKQQSKGKESSGKEYDSFKKKYDSLAMEKPKTGFKFPKIGIPGLFKKKPEISALLAEKIPEIKTSNIKNPDKKENAGAPEKSVKAASPKTSSPKSSSKNNPKVMEILINQNSASQKLPDKKNLEDKAARPAEPLKKESVFSRLFRKKEPDDKRTELIPEAKEKGNFFSKLFKKKEGGLFEHQALKPSLFKRKKQKEQESRKNRLREYLLKAGFEIESQILSKKLFNLAILINFIISVYIIYRFATDMKLGVFYLTALMAFIWVFVFIAILFIVWLLLFIIIDLKIFRRRVDIEEVLPDYLQLTSANIRAGMPIDQALWYAVRPRFGVLANEIEIVAKETMSGVELNEALRKFAEKYDSQVLKRSINLLIEGLEAGGEVGDLLNKISNNIQKIQLLRKEMSANVTTYAIFISVATVFASPFLFALSGQLLTVVSNILSKIKLPNTATTANFPIKLSQVGLSYHDFMIFAIVSLTISSFFSALIIATIRKGDVKAGIKYIPMFIITSVALFFIYTSLFKGMFGSIF